MGKSKGKVNLNYNLKDKSEEQTLVYLIGYHRKRFKISTKQSVYTKTWNVEKQRCVISSDFQDRINRASRRVNKFLDALDKGITDYFSKLGGFRGDDSTYFGTPEYIKECIQIGRKLMI